MVSFYASQRTWLPELAESVPIDGIPQLRPLQYQLRDPYISRRSPETFTAQSHFAFPELSRLVCSLLVAILLTGCSDLLSFFSLIISQVPLLARCTSLPVFPFSQTNLCFIPFLEFVLFVFPIRPPRPPGFPLRTSAAGAIAPRGIVILLGLRPIFIPTTPADDQPALCCTPSHLVSTVYSHAATFILMSQ